MNIKSTNPTRALAACIFSTVAATGAFAQALPATNDARALFESGTFRLPPLAGSKDVYTIIVEAAEGKARKLLLPAGSTGLIVGPGALPTGSWRWRYSLQTEQVEQFKAYGAAEQRVTYADLVRYADAVPLEWEHTKAATAYRVVTQTDKQLNHSAAPDWGDEAKTELSVEENVDVASNRGHYNLPLAAGARVQWKVQALDSDGKVLAQTEPRMIVADGLWSAAASNAGFKLQRADTLSSKEVAAKPAVIGYSSAKTDGKRTSAYQAEFAVIWTGGQDRNFNGFYPRASVEARLHSVGADKDSDAVKLRFGGYKVLQSIDGEIAANFKYETESKKDTKKALLEFAFTPTFFPFASVLPRPTRDRTGPDGNYRIGEAPAVQVLPQLTVGMDLGKTLEAGSSGETKKSLFRQWADLRLDLQLNFLSDALRIPLVTLYGQTKRWHLNGESPSRYHLSTAGLNFQMTKELSLDMSYSVGADAPAFKFNRNALVGLGLKF